MRSDLPISRERIASDLEELAAITATPGEGVTRLAFTAEDIRARDLAGRWLEGAGLRVRVDGAGNLIGRRAGADDQAPVVLCGSHLDSVLHGGRFDGTVGVLGALEVMRALAATGIRTKVSLEVVAFAAEESARFGQTAHRFGSRAMAALVAPDTAEQARDAAGMTLADAMRSCGLDPHHVAAARRTPEEIGAYVELHIEQGDILARAGRPVGAVTCITGTTRLRAELEGSADHSGTTPMPARRDALAGAAEIILGVERIAAIPGGSLVATVGTINAEPNSISVVPGRVAIGVDVRDMLGPPREQAVAEIRALILEVAERRRLHAVMRTSRDDSPTPLSAHIQELTVEACAACGIGCMRVPSHSGHDATSISAIAETGMIFLRNVSGRSHSPAEQVELADIVLGVRALAGTLLRLAGVVGEDA